MFVGSWQAALCIQGVPAMLLSGSLRLSAACKLWLQVVLTQAAARSLLFVLAAAGCRQCVA